MSAIEYVALVDTTRDELRQRIALAQERFGRLIRAADPCARPPSSDWSVQQIAAHVLTVAHRYRDTARGHEYRRAITPREVATINQTELDAAMAPLSELADQLRAAAPELESYFDTLNAPMPTIPFHAGMFVDGITAQTNWLGELLVHGFDIAHAANVSWELPERDMLLVSRGMMQIGSGYPLRAGIRSGTDVCVEFQIPTARPYLVRIAGGAAEFRARRPDDCADAVLRTPASTVALMLYQRIGPFTAARHGLRIVGGRRPWRAVKLQSYFERP